MINYKYDTYDFSVSSITLMFYVNYYWIVKMYLLSIDTMHDYKPIAKVLQNVKYKQEWKCNKKWLL